MCSVIFCLKGPEIKISNDIHIPITQLVQDGAHHFGSSFILIYNSCDHIRYERNIELYCQHMILSFFSEIIGSETCRRLILPFISHARDYQHDERNNIGYHFIQFF